MGQGGKRGVRSVECGVGEWGSGRVGEWGVGVGNCLKVIVNESRFIVIFGCDRPPNFVFGFFGYDGNGHKMALAKIGRK